VQCSAVEQYVEPQFLAKRRPIPKISGGTVGSEVNLGEGGRAPP
jgi:hypothetical protein